MISVANKLDCCGCSACANICPSGSISMMRDSEGFLYPSVDMNKCFKCGLCKKTCPILNLAHEIEKKQTAYVVQHVDETILAQSTSGGAFTAIAQYVIERGGIVWGAAFDENFNVHHTGANTLDKLQLFRGSKYVQSDIGSTYRDIKLFLDKGRYVCFSGTPCQVEGLLKYLNRPYDNLITVDVVCRAVPTPLLWEKYVRMQQRRYKNQITRFRFRDKSKYGYLGSTIAAISEERYLYRKGIALDSFLRAFFSDICDRPSCYACKFKKRYRVSDFTIWDCFCANIFAPELDDNRGATCMLIQSDKGKRVFDKIATDLRRIQVEADKITEEAKELTCSVSVNKLRGDFMQDLLLLDGEELFNKYFPTSFSKRVENAVRAVSIRLGVFRIIKKASKKVLKRYKR
ncbi:hydrogenase [Desulfitobacterium hafniense]|uniref:Hydrogenase n=1 Tax=Desulfitobacterium hafniense TaxID=49338 RepID=A0A0W1JQK1_DESHA|nr:Coenzyme F420 hydrogenase/dehydrogenase, beta subunit C-terminal domain [Desulfitobacterium hafniense]KTE93872.1 hydrogenase [Desulfitobacterium hafniense]